MTTGGGPDNNVPATGTLASGNWQQYMNQGYKNPMYQALNQEQGAIQGEAGVAQQEGQLVGQYMNQAAPQMQAAQLAAAQQAQAAQLGNASQAQAGQIAPTMMTNGAQINTANEDQTRAQQQAFLGQLQQQANGQGPSVAALQAKNSADQATAQMQGTLGSQRGSSNSSLNLRMAAQQAQGNQQNAANQAMIGRTQEQLNAQGQLGNALAGVRGADQNTAFNQAQLGQQAMLSNQSQYNAAAQQQAQMNQQNSQFNAGANNTYGLQQGQFNQQANLANQDAANQFALQQGQFQQGANQNNLSSQLQQTGMNNNMVGNLLAGQSNTYGNIAGQNQNMAGMLVSQGQQQQAIQNQQQQMAIGAATGLASTGFAAMSDKRSKTEIKDGKKDLREFLDALSTKTYRYKDPTMPGAKDGKFMSPMAQDLAKSELGKDMLEQGPNGMLMVDYSRAVGTVMSAQKDLDDRLKRMEELLKKSKKNKGKN